jgi:PPM family protein phosphatase
MRFPDPYSLKQESTRDFVIFAAGQLQSEKKIQEHYFLNFNDECFALSRGADGFAHGDVASTLTCETAIWGYKHIRQHKFYRQDKKLFMKRIFRTTNMTMWQKRREKGFEDGLASTLLVLMIGQKSFWLGNAGDSSAWMYKNARLVKLTSDDVDTNGKLTKAVGLNRLGLLPSYKTGLFELGETIVVTSSTVANYLHEQDFIAPLAASGDSAESLSQTVSELLKKARERGSKENLTAIVVKRI